MRDDEYTGLFGQVTRKGVLRLFLVSVFLVGVGIGLVALKSIFFPEVVVEVINESGAELAEIDVMVADVQGETCGALVPGAGFESRFEVVEDGEVSVAFLLDNTIYSLNAGNAVRGGDAKYVVRVSSDSVAEVVKLDYRFGIFPVAVDSSTVPVTALKNPHP